MADEELSEMNPKKKKFVFIEPKLSECAHVGKRERA